MLFLHKAMNKFMHEILGIFIIFTPILEINI
ncbi:hypothetical protein J2Y38_000065 [Flavobacterium sp. 2755]|nr:hypothetical protein [Flavobacterium sp. 2755]